MAISTIRLAALPRYIRMFLLAFVVALSFGYYTGFAFLNQRTSLEPGGIEESYIGNEDDEEATEFKFKKSESELLIIIHTHVTSMALIFLALGALIVMTGIPVWLKSILLIEPFVSMILTFGGIWVMWKGLLWFKYVIMVSGMLLNLSFVAMALILVVTLLRPIREAR